ncbi:hypothetical protein HPY42_00050 [Coprothermobacteraceae bacterium]|nr:hypothetical protein [Coprothermobacteraceae bacterium]
MDSQDYSLLADIVQTIDTSTGRAGIFIFARPQTELGDDILGYILSAVFRAKGEPTLSFTTTALRPELGFRLVDHVRRLRPRYDFVVNGPCFGGANLLAVSANNLYFTHTGEMGLWWGSVNTPWNPVDENHRYLPMDVELLLAYLQLLSKYPQAVEPITKDVSPLALSAVYNHYKKMLQALANLEAVVEHGQSVRGIRLALEQDYALGMMPWGPSLAASYGLPVRALDPKLEPVFNELNGRVFNEFLVPQRHGSAENYRVIVPDVVILTSQVALVHTTYIEGTVIDTEVEERPVGADWRTAFQR